MKQNLAVGTMLALLGVLGSSDAGAHTAPSAGRSWKAPSPMATFTHKPERGS